MIFWLRTNAASIHHPMHSLARIVSAWVHVQLEAVREQTHLLVAYCLSQGASLPGKRRFCAAYMQQVLAPALAVNSKFLNSYLEQRMRSKRWAVICRSPEMSWFDMTHLLPSFPNLLRPHRSVLNQFFHLSQDSQFKQSRRSWKQIYNEAGSHYMLALHQRWPYCKGIIQWIYFDFAHSISRHPHHGDARCGSWVSGSRRPDAWE